MALFQKDSLENLRHRIDLVEVLQDHLEMKAAGGSYKACCPFHDEKSPSFTVKRGDTHYHCFGCGAHGDAIQFLMMNQQMAFTDAVESLAQRFNVHLDKEEGGKEYRGPNKQKLKDLMDKASSFFQAYLLHTQEGQQALEYLYNRGIDLAFIRRFRIGFAPKEAGIFRKLMYSMHFNNEELLAAGLIAERENGRMRDFFYDRIMFPISDTGGRVIGFSGRKFQESTFGGKYVNSPEGPLFKKSRILFGLSHCRRRIAKERKAIIVEGQVDALRLIDSGMDITVAGQGTAFGEGHVLELKKLGLEEAILALDADNAGKEASLKIGHLCQKEGIGVKVVRLPKGQDPDNFLCDEGPEAFTRLIEESSDYLSFMISCLSEKYPINNPAAKNLLINQVVKNVREWNDAVLVHETLRQLALKMDVPPEALGAAVQQLPSNVYLHKSSSIGEGKKSIIDPDRILEADLIRWLVLLGQSRSDLLELAKRNLSLEHFRNAECRKIYQVYLDLEEAQSPRDPLALASLLDDESCSALMELLERKINLDRVELHYKETIQRLLNKHWMQERETLKVKMSSGTCSNTELLELARKFDALKGKPPKFQELQEVHA
jgi:DNA primase